jgi:hypothetical protein
MQDKGFIIILKKTTLKLTNSLRCHSWIPYTGICCIGQLDQYITTVNS